MRVQTELPDRHQWVWWHRELARALNADGDHAGAVAERARFAALWSAADPVSDR